VRTLVLLRHAKSSWDDPALGDFERPLAPRGKRDAPKIGRFLASSGAEVDFVLCSNAVRARETWKLVAKAARFGGLVEFTDEIYEAPAERLMRLVRGLPDTAACAMLVGHNPGFEDLIRVLCSRESRMSVTVPTGALACVDCNADRWEGVSPAAGSLRWLVVPKILGD
jgi:phosphohistidine phosphatase